MYIFKNAYLSIIRRIGRNILIAIVITIITIGSFVALAINNSGNELVESYKENNPLIVNFTLDTMNLREASDEEKENYKALTKEDIEKYGDSSYVEGYYYSKETTLSSEKIDAIDNSVLKFDDEEKNKNIPNRGGKGMIPSQGDFRFTSYSDFSYLEDFISGNKKIISGSMIEKDNKEKLIVISEELAKENDIEVGDKITFYLPSNEDTTFKLEVYGIYEETILEEENSSFMNMTSMTSSNQIYTNMTTMDNILSKTEDEEEEKYRMMASNGLTAKFYLTSQNDLEAFEEEVREKGLSDFYQVGTNEEEILASLKPIQNLSDYSLSFLIVILIIGAVILTIINMINIRERKYEIGVLRAIGMKKSKVNLQILTETLMVAIIALFIGSLTGLFVSQPVTNQMLKNEIESYQQESMEKTQNFGSDKFAGGPGGMRENMNQMVERYGRVDYLNNLTITIDLGVIANLLGLSLILIACSSFVSVMYINRYDPNKILQNRG